MSANLMVLETIGGSSRAPNTLAESNTTPLPVLRPLSDFITSQIILHAIHYNRSDKLSIARGLSEEDNALKSKILDDPHTRHRFIFSYWPRPLGIRDAVNQDPKPYEYITPENAELGKMAPGNIQLWGETLFDFYWVKRIPECPNLQTLSTGSRLAQWARKFGEAETISKNEVDWANLEKDPQKVDVYDLEQLLEEQESYLLLGQKDAARHEGGNGDEPTKDAHSAPQPPTYPLPFSKTWNWNSDRIPFLETYIPQSRLLSKLTVHDPWGLLSVNGAQYKATSWDEKAKAYPDRVYEYKLSLDQRYKARRREEEEEEAKEQARKKEKRDRFLANPHSSFRTAPEGIEVWDWESIDSPTCTVDQIPKKGPTKPLVYVILPPHPPLADIDTESSEVHLYLSPQRSVGTGNHSEVYEAEWEVPRDWVVKDALCLDCVRCEVSRRLKEEDGKDGARRDKKWDDVNGGKWVTTKRGVCPRVISVGTANLDGTVSGDPPIQYLVEEPVASQENLEYEGPYRIIDLSDSSQATSFYQNPRRAPYCQHLQPTDSAAKAWAEGRGTYIHSHPLTTKVRVCAKLSKQGDLHLAQEATNYQRFRKYLFERYTGFNILEPLHDPTPVGRIVPCFYGYYVPVDGKSSSYRSPILLVEHCGESIDPDKLTIDDKHECIALFLRLHHAGWVHLSFAKRNIVRKPGPLTAHPSQRIENAKKRGGYGTEWDYRIIDFGRSEWGGRRRELEMIGHDGEEQDDDGQEGVWDEIRSEDRKLRNWLDGISPLY